MTAKYANVNASDVQDMQSLEEAIDFAKADAEEMDEDIYVVQLVKLVKPNKGATVQDA